MNLLAQPLQKAFAQKGIKIEIPESEMETETNPDLVPMMYRAQISGRCGLQYGKNNRDLRNWTEQWVYPQDNQQPLYQYSKPTLGLDASGSIYRLELKFPLRVFINCGQDSIARPVMGKDGIPFIGGNRRFVRRSAACC